jgi:hypothetical protein
MAPASPQGGTLVDGVYDMVAAPGDPGQSTKRATIAILRGGSLLEVVYSVSSTAPESRFSRVLRPKLMPSQTYVTAEQGCSMNSFGDVLDYTATGTTLIISSPGDLGTNAIFQRRCP